MIGLSRCGAQENERYLPDVMTQGNASTYQTMIESGMPQTGTVMNEPSGGSGESGAMIAGAQGAGFGMAQSGETFAGLAPLPVGSADVDRFAGETLRGSWKSMMARNIGRSVIVSFLIGTQGTIVARGILYEVGSDYIALYQPQARSYISADLYSIRFMEFLPEEKQGLQQ